MHLLCLSDDARSRCCTTPLVVRGVSTKSESPQSYAALEVSTRRRIGASRLQQHPVSLTHGNVGIVFVAEVGTCTSLAGTPFPRRVEREWNSRAWEALSPGGDEPQKGDTAGH